MFQTFHPEDEKAAASGAGPVSADVTIHKIIEFTQKVISVIAAFF